VRRLARLITLFGRVLRACAPIAWLLLAPVNPEEATPIAGLLVFVGLLAGLPSLVGFLWSGPELERRPRLRAGQQLSVPHLLRRSGKLVAYLFGMSLLFSLSGAPGPATLMALLGFLVVIAPAAQRYDPARDRAVLATQLASLLRMGVPLAEGLEKLAVDARGRLRTRFQGVPQILYYLSQDIRAGAQLSYAVSCQAYFPAYWVSLTSLGERTDALPEELDRLSLMEQQRAAGPGVLRLMITLAVVLLLGMFLNTYIRPTFAAIAEGIGVTGAIFHLWDLGALLIKLTLLLFCLAAFRRAFGRAHGGAGRLAAWLRLRLPLWGPALRVEQQSLALLALLAGARQHRSLAEMLGLARECVDLPPYQRLLNPERARAGTSLAGCLSQPAGLFAPEVIWLVRQGELTGQLVGALEMALSHLEELREDRQRRLLLGVDLGLQLFLGLLVALYMFGFWLPILGYYGMLLEESVL